MRYFEKTGKEDKFGVETDVGKRSIRKAIANAQPIPLVGNLLEGEVALTKKHPTLALVSGQAGLLGAVSKNTGKDYYRSAVLTGIAGGVGTGVLGALVGKALNPLLKKTLPSLIKVSPRLGNVVKKTSRALDLPIPETIGRGMLIGGIGAALTSPIHYAIGKKYAKVYSKKSYEKKSSIFDDVIHNPVFKYIDKNVDYAGSVLRHKWEVYKGAKDLDVPFFQAAGHDINKFDPLLFTIYRDFFYGDRKNPAVQRKFRAAAHLHRVTNPHHLYATKIPSDFDDIDNSMEAIADWYAATKRSRYYPKNFPTMEDWIIKSKPWLIKKVGRKVYNEALRRASD